MEYLCADNLILIIESAVIEECSVPDKAMNGDGLNLLTDQLDWPLEILPAFTLTALSWGCAWARLEFAAAIVKIVTHSNSSPLVHWSRIMCPWMPGAGTTVCCATKMLYKYLHCSSVNLTIQSNWKMPDQGTMPGVWRRYFYLKFFLVREWYWSET